MNRKPIIGIVGKVSPNFSEDLWHRNRVVDELVKIFVDKCE